MPEIMEINNMLLAHVIYFLWKQLIQLFYSLQNYTPKKEIYVELFK